MNNLQPQEVFSIFQQITQVPRPSKHEEKICQWLIGFARQHNIEYEFLPLAENAATGNIILRKPATRGYESHLGVILQAHMDMVCEKNSDIRHDFFADPIQTYVDGDWVKARGTTLGADNGIGMAMMLAALTSTTMEHPALECLFTVDEETGLTGANNLPDGHLQGKRLINLDSEDDGQIFIGCAGGIDTLAKLYYEPITLSQANFFAPSGVGQEDIHWFAAEVKVSGLLGGHSGDDINKGRANANKVLVRFLFEVEQQLQRRQMGTMLLSRIDGGNLRNAIAREASALICVPFAYKEQLRIDFNTFVAEIEAEILDVEKGVQLSLESTELPKTVIPKGVSDKLLLSLYACPHGVFAMSKDMPGLVETSTNLASVKTKKDGNGHFIEINTSQRSSVESQKHNLKNMVECALALSGAEVSHGDGYPGWKPDVNSGLLAVTRQAYIGLTGKEPEVRAIHAGLECGLFLEKYPYLDMVSIGPQMTGVHSPMEQLSISSTAKTWQWLQRTLQAL